MTRSPVEARKERNRERHRAVSPSDHWHPCAFSSADGKRVQTSHEGAARSTVLALDTGLPQVEEGGGRLACVSLSFWTMGCNRRSDPLLRKVS